MQQRIRALRRDRARRRPFSSQTATDMLARIVKNEQKGTYAIDPETGVYSARGFEIDAGRHFRYFNAFHVPGKGEEIA